jgi:hypothetical protein
MKRLILMTSVFFLFSDFLMATEITKIYTGSLLVAEYGLNDKEEQLINTHTWRVGIKGQSETILGRISGSVAFSHDLSGGKSLATYFIQPIFANWLRLGYIPRPIAMNHRPEPVSADSHLELPSYQLIPGHDLGISFVNQLNKVGLKMAIHRTRVKENSTSFDLNKSKNLPEVGVGVTIKNNSLSGYYNERHKGVAITLTGKRLSATNVITDEGKSSLVSLSFSPISIYGFSVWQKKLDKWEIGITHETSTKDTTPFKILFGTAYRYINSCIPNGEPDKIVYFFFFVHRTWQR